MFMWIKYIKLENFASIKVGLKQRQIYIDFSNRKNHICLLSGPNGIGKTSLLSTFTPFAGVGNLDVRDSENLILSGESGYKEICIMNGSDEYIIKHFYSPNKESHTIKSYVLKNGEELNVNGNVRSFLAVINDELGIEPNYLKLIRLGNNVTNLLQLSATDRKKFLSTLLQELDVYLAYFKKLTEDGRVIKSQIASISDRLSKTKIESLETGEKELRLLEKEIKSLEDEKEDLIQRQGICENGLSQIDYDAVISEAKSLSKKMTKAENALEKKGSLTKEACEKLISNLEKAIQSASTEIQVLNTQIATKLNEIDGNIRELESLNHEIDKIEKNEDLISAKNIFYDLRKRYHHEESICSDYHPAFTKEELNQVMSICIDINNQMSLVYEFGKAPVEKVVSLLRKNKNVNNYINNGLLDADKDKRSALLYKLIDGVNDIDPNCDHKSCSLYQLWIQIKNLMREEEVVRESHGTEEFYKYMNIIYQKITECLDKTGEIKEIIVKLPNSLQNEFILDTVFQRIENLKPVFQMDRFNVTLSEITEYENFLMMKDQLKEAEARYDILRKSNNAKYFEKRKEEVEELRDHNIEALKSLKEKLEKQQDLFEESTNDLDTYQNILIGLTEMDEMHEKYSLLFQQASQYQDLKNRRDFVINNLAIKNNKLSTKKVEYLNLSHMIEVYKSLAKDLKHMMKLYDENTIIKRALSTKEGIPLEFINIYMSNIKKTINELLTIVYDGDLIIDDFKINADEFRIPFIRDGYLISDIKQASQGETAFLSLALSFALISESILNYNIILLDEIDGNLDDGKRKKFISILEKLIEMIQADQIFLISHNNLFSMYPVDVLSLTGEIDTGMSLANYIPIYFEF